MPAESLVVVGVAFVVLVVFAPLPGRIARRRGHPQSDAIAAAGWLSILTAGITLPIALIWAYTIPRNQPSHREFQDEIDEIVSQVRDLRSRVDLIETLDACDGPEDKRQ